MSRYRHELVWPPFKGKAHKVVDTSTGQGVGLYRTPTGAQRKINALHEADRVAALTCTRCGQVSITRATPNVCRTCVAALERQARVPQGETVKLFEPAPAQIRGQLSF